MYLLAEMPFDKGYPTPLSFSLLALSCNPSCAGGSERVDMWVRCKSIGPGITELVRCDPETFLSRKSHVLPLKSYHRRDLR